MSHLHHPTLLHNRLPYFGRTGLVRNGLVAEYRFDESKNLLKYSQQFDNAAWTKTNATATGNATTAPDGTTTADKLIEASDTNQIHGVYQRPTIEPNTTYTFSFYVKAGERSVVRITTSDSMGGSDVTFFNAATGAFGTIDPQHTATVYNAGSGWYRVCLTYASLNGSSGAKEIYIRLCSDATTYQYSGDGTSGIYIWGAQLEIGSVARTYVPTTDKQLLMDYSRPRKNLLLPNQANACEDGTVPFTKLTAGDAVTASAGEVDEWQGTYCAKVDTANAAANEGIYTTDIIYNLKPSTAYTASGYIRGASGGETVKLGLRETTDAGVTVDTTGSDTLTLTTGWQRVTVSRTFGATGRGARLLVYTPTQQNIVFYVDGLQLEEGSTATAWEAPPNIGVCGSTTGIDTNDPTYTGQGALCTTDDSIRSGQIVDSAGAAKSGYGITVIFYTPSDITAASSSQPILGLGDSTDVNTMWAVYTGSHTGQLTNELITISQGTNVATLYRTGWCDGSATITAGWHILDLVWNGTNYEIYYDGSKKTSTAGTSGHVQTPIPLSKVIFGGIWINNSLAGSWASGGLAYALLYSRALTQAEISQNYAYLKSYLLRERGISLA
jgi:hypothetical protein